MKKKVKKKYKKIGILGGTFDPPHVGHLNISKIALKKLKLNKLIWIITKQNPLKKKPYLSIKMRIDLCKQITKTEKNIFIKYFEDRIKSRNTIDLLKHFKKKYKKTNLYFLIGADSLLGFHKWKSWKKIPEFAKIAVFDRHNYSSKILSYIRSKRLEKNDWIHINSKKINISSSLIKKF